MAAPHLAVVQQVGVEVGVDMPEVDPVQGLQGKALQEETIHLDPVLGVVVLDQQVSPLQAQVLQMLLAVTADSAMVARPSPFSWMASNTAVVVVVEVQETQERISQEALDMQAVEMVVVATMTQQLTARMRPTAQEEVAVVAVISTLAATSPQAAQVVQAL